MYVDPYQAKLDALAAQKAANAAKTAAPAVALSPVKPSTSPKPTTSPTPSNDASSPKPAAGRSGSITNSSTLPSVKSFSVPIAVESSGPAAPLAPVSGVHKYDDLKAN